MCYLTMNSNCMELVNFLKCARHFQRTKYLSLFSSTTNNGWFDGKYSEGFIIIQHHQLRFNLIRQVEVLSKILVTLDSSIGISQILTKLSSFFASECSSMVSYIHYGYWFQISPRGLEHWRLEKFFGIIGHSFFSTTCWSTQCKCPRRTRERRGSAGAKLLLPRKLLLVLRLPTPRPGEAVVVGWKFCWLI